jgi:hypothetical protein
MSGVAPPELPEPAGPGRGPGSEQRRVALLALVVAGVAVVIAIAAVGVAITALARSDNGRVAAAGPSPTGVRVPAGTTAPAPDGSAPATTGPAAAPSESDGGIVVPTTEPEVAYQDRELRIQPPSVCGGTRLVDVDEPRVSPEANLAEFSYGACGTPIAQVDVADGLQISTVPSPTATATDCAKAIRDGPVNEPLTPTAGMNLCLVTSRTQAADEGQSQKIVLLSVLSIAKDGTMVARLSAWKLAP